MVKSKKASKVEKAVELMDIKTFGGTITIDNDKVCIGSECIDITIDRKTEEVVFELKGDSDCGELLPIILDMATKTYPRKVNVPPRSE